MKALDTNVLARILLADDAQQTAKAAKLLQTEPALTAPVTVMLELVWVLETQGLQAKDIAASLYKLLALPNFNPQHQHELRTALNQYADGMDFADALHLALSGRAESMISFDKAFAKQAAKRGLIPAVECFLIFKSQNKKSIPNAKEPAIQDKLKYR